MAADGVTMECGYCLQKDAALVEPKILPCSHTHCLGCLTAFFNLHHVVRCPKCSEVYDVTLDSLPAASPMGDNSLYCDICTRKGVPNQPAETYCTTCSKKYCKKHQEAHDDLHEDHPKIGISEYRSRAGKLEIRACTKHGVPFTLGCKICLTVMCLKCINDMSTCTDGTSHELKSLDELVDILTKAVNESKAEVIDKEEKLEELFKSISKIAADYEAETKEMIERIHQRRDEQIEAIKEKYKNLEKELIELRGHCKSAMTKFMEEDVGRKLSDLSLSRMKIEARVKHSHQVDIVTEYRNTKDVIQKLVHGEIPELKLEKMSKLESKDEARGIELEIASVKGLINLEMGLTTSKPIPKALQLQQTINIHQYNRSVCSYQAYTYVGLCNNTVSRIDSNYQVTNSFLTLGGLVQGITVYKDRLYTLVQGTPYKVYVHSLSGQLITKWDHIDSDNTDINKLAIINDQIIIPDTRKKRLTVYSLTGQTVKHIPCPQISNHWVSICAADSDSVIVSDYKSNQVFRVNIPTGEVMWTSTHVTKPEGVVCYGQSCVLVASYNSDKIRILDAGTGAFLSEITDGHLPNDHIFDLHISGNSLIAAVNSTQQVLFYHMD